MKYICIESKNIFEKGLLYDIVEKFYNGKLIKYIKVEYKGDFLFYKLEVYKDYLISPKEYRNRRLKKLGI